ncbi:MAG: diguanylate cyclase [Proteobacteria bacterium]|nr:diguanylate cyclase [Pseudomonadota bacterium]MBU1686584.1 diguanylate cyclase [Pseudomonadota bacterium]
MGAGERKRRGGFFDWIECSRGNILGCLLRKCLDTSVAGKLIGILIVSIVGFALLITINHFTLNRIKLLNQDLNNISIPQYKISQYVLRSLNGFKISLLHILDTDELREDDLNVRTNLERLSQMERMIIALQKGGSIMDVAKISQKTLDVFAVSPSGDSQVKAIVEEIIQEYSYLSESFNNLIAAKLSEDEDEVVLDAALADLVDALDDMHEVVTSLAIMINNNNNVNFNEIERIITSTQNKAILVGIVLVIVLSIGSIFYMILIVSPLADITEKIHHIAIGDSDHAERIEVRTHDEIGQLAQNLNKLIDNIFSLNAFKAVIEEEESTTEVNQRLATLLQERYLLDKLYIYEVSGSKNNMSIAFLSDPKDVCHTDILDDGNFCRAKRTGHPVSSLQYPDICKIFPHSDRMDHHCIPMIANGRAVGVVQFLCDKAASAVEKKDFEDRVKRADRYIREATPVIEAKRFASALQESTFKDPLTDLYNRRFLESYSDTLVANTLRRRTKVGILMCDMDFFKEVNDTHGHETGDIVLIKTAEVLQSCVRASDMIIRYGGEEFLVLLIDVKSREDIAELAERIRSSMEKTVINIPDGALRKTVSIGYSEFPSDTEGFWESIKYADVALYRAKEGGRNKIVGFVKEMWDKAEY